MKIIQVIPNLDLGGGETMCESLIYELSKKGNKVIALSLYDLKTAITERLISRGIEVRFLHKKRGVDISLIGKLKRIFKEEKPDAVHTHLGAARYVFPAAKMAKVRKVVHTVHNIAQKESPKLSRIMYRSYFKSGYAIPVALSDIIRDTIVEEYKLSEDKIPVILNGINLSNCVPKNDYDICGNFKILHIGRFSLQKNHTALIEAFDLFHSKYPDSELWLVGDGEEREKAVGMTEEKGLSEHVKFLGKQSNVYTFLHDADIFTLPSNYEGIPMTLIEAMGTGLPIAATPVGGIPDMLEKNVDALLVENNVKAIADAFEKYYSDRELRQLHGQRAMGKADAFSSKIMAEKYLEVYKL